jgi:hypothetical protein
MKRNQNSLEERKQIALERLGTDDPRCVVCSEVDWRCLELHHFEQEKYGDDLSIVCRNCHRKLSDAQSDHPPPLPGGVPGLFERIGHFLLGLADLLNLLVEKCVEYGSALIEFAKVQSKQERNNDRAA